MKKKIVIIDDNTSLVDVVKRFLMMKEFEVFTAYDGTNGIKTVRKYLPDLILLDIMMPKLSGYEVCKELKKTEQLKQIPIIFLTVRSRPEDIEKGYKLGAVDYVTKPFNYPQLIEKIIKVLTNHTGIMEE